MDKENRQEPSSKPKTNKIRFALNIGFYAGLLWGGLKIIEHFFRFTSLTPGFLIEQFYKHAFLLTWQGILVGWVAYIIFSMFAAVLYAWLMAKASGPWFGFFYGLVWWALLFLLIGPITGMTTWIMYMDWNTIITDLCLFLLWGLFIGYSISFEFTDERVREPIKRQSKDPKPA